LRALASAPRYEEHANQNSTRGRIALSDVDPPASRIFLMRYRASRYLSAIRVQGGGSEK